MWQQQKPLEEADRVLLLDMPTPTPSWSWHFAKKYAYALKFGPQICTWVNISNKIHGSACDIFQSKQKSLIGHTQKQSQSKEKFIFLSVGWINLKLFLCFPPFLPTCIHIFPLTSGGGIKLVFWRAAVAWREWSESLRNTVSRILWMSGLLWMVCRVECGIYNRWLV